MCWEGLAVILRPLLTKRGTGVMTQTESIYFQRCEACNIVFDLDGDESKAGDCGVCQRYICYPCSYMLAWDDASSELQNICDHCRDEFLVMGSARKFDVHEVCEAINP